MSTGTAIGLVIAVLALVATIAFYANDQVDKKIEKAISSPELLSQLAKRMQLPFLIVDENEVYRYDHNAHELIDSVSVEKNEKNEITKIVIVPKSMLDAPPIIEPINFFMSFAEPKKAKPFSWEFYPAQEEFDYIVARAGEADPERKLIKQFKITLIKTD